MVFPGSDRFFIGLLSRFRQWQQIRRTQKMPVKLGYYWMLDTLKTGEYVRDSFNACGSPVICFNVVSQLNLIITDPGIIQEMFTSKNNIVDKNGIIKIIFEDFFGESFLFSKGDDVWRARRKATAHAFYKENLVHLLEVLK